jgi:uncharacterized protein (TIGR02145 family)
MKRVKESSKVAMLIAMFAITFTSTAFAQEKGAFTDPRDKKKYSTVKIGEQTWMAENLNYSAKGKCYDDKPANCTKYGRLYDWVTAMALPSSCDNKNNKPCAEKVKAKHAGICPKGWHIPSNEEWDKLIDYVENDKGCTGCAGKFLKSKEGWNDSYTKNLATAKTSSAFPPCREAAALTRVIPFTLSAMSAITATGGLLQRTVATLLTSEA